MSSLKDTISFNKDHLSLGVVFVCILALLLLPSGWVESPTITPEPVTEEVSKDNTNTETASTPSTIRIPKMDLVAPFGETLGLRTNGEVEVPTDFETVGWYKYSPKPGELGPAVVLGHVDSRYGPSVFYSLGQLVPGDNIYITDEVGVERTFIVESSELYEQQAFPTELVYGDIDHAGLRLITCSGWYSRDADRYSHNRIVFARLIE